MQQRTFFGPDEDKPGEFPYTRGIHEEMYTKGRLPTVRKYGGFGSGSDLNKHLKKQIELGVTGLSIAYDLPTQMGLDPDHPMAAGEVGVNGVSIACLQDYERAFAGILPLIVEKGIGVSKTINATAPVLLAFYVAAAKKQGVDPTNLRGTIQNDVLKEYLSRNTHIYPLGGTLRLVRDIFLYCRTGLAKFNTISICGYHMREKGATASQELAYMFANAIQYVATAVGAGMGVDELAPQISFFINVKKNFMEEIAKLRAARRMWAYIARDGFGARDSRSMKLRMQVYTGGSDLRAEKPQLNIVRDAVRTMAAVLGGPQGVNTTSFDEAITIPTDLSQAIAIDTPYIVLMEKGVTRVADPAGGSHFLEAKTCELEKEAWKELEKISAMPSYQKALSYMRATLEEQAYREQQEEDAGRKIVVGKNAGLDHAELYPKVELFKAGSDPQKFQKIRLKEFAAWKKRRNGAKVQEALASLEAAARDPQANIMPFVVEAVEAEATLGEISDTLKKVFGSADPADPWNPGEPVEVFNARVRGLIAQQKEKEYPQPPQLRSGQAVFSLRQRGQKMGSGALRRKLKPVEGWRWREQGANAGQEAALALYEALLKNKNCIGLASGNNFFREIAKFRAIRRVWDQRGSKKKLILYVRTAPDTLTKQKPWNNIVRVALQGLQAILGGADYVELLPFDHPFYAHTLARSHVRTTWSPWAEQMRKDMHLMLEHEFGLTEAPDLLGGSYYLEALTDELEREIKQMLEAISALPYEDAQRRIAEALESRRKSFKADDQRLVIGVTLQTEGPSPKPELLSK